MNLQPCHCCGYLLPLQSHDQLCPECGKDDTARTVAAHRCTFANVTSSAFIGFISPVLLHAITLALGWCIAHLFLGIGNRAVDHGEYASLDFLGAFAHLFLFLSICALPFAMILLPVAVCANVRAVAIRVQSRTRFWAFILLAALPFAIAFILFGPTRSIVPSFGSWLPD